MKQLVLLPAVILGLMGALALVFKLRAPKPEGQIHSPRMAMSEITKPEISESDLSKPPAEVFKNPAVMSSPKKVKRSNQVKAVPAGTAEVALSSFEPTPVSAQVSIPQELKVKTSGNGPFDVAFLAAHASGKAGEVRDFSEFLVEARYRFNDKTSVGLGQEAKKLYEIAAVGEEEFLPGDTRLYLSRELSRDFFTIQWDLEVGATLPISKESRDNKHVTRPYFLIRASRSFFNDLLTVGYSPFVSYSFNQFATDGAGKPLQKIVFGQGLDASIAILRNRVYLKGWAKGYHRTYEEFDFSKTTPAGTESFDLGSALAFKVTEQVGIEAGVTRGTSVLSDLRYDSSFYDQEQTRVFAALKVSL